MKEAAEPLKGDGPLAGRALGTKRASPVLTLTCICLVVGSGLLVASFPALLRAMGGRISTCPCLGRIASLFQPAGAYSSNQAAWISGAVPHACQLHGGRFSRLALLIKHDATSN
jgi:hypothetical protein